VDFKSLELVSKKCRYDIVRMIGNANSGHIGGSMSSIDIYVLLHYIMGNEDYLVVSHGHTCAALYSVLGNMGYFDIEDAVASFRKTPPFEGHPSTNVNGVQWCSGSLGQGLSVGCGFALAKKIKNEDGRVFVVMGDGEQQKGQLQEAREFAINHKLDNLVAIVDYNGLQASGALLGDISIWDKYTMSGWNVIEADGHNFEAIYNALQNKGPLCIIAKTVMGKDIPEIENNYKFHGTVVNDDVYKKSLERFKLTKQEEKQLIKKTREIKKYTYPQIMTEKKAKYYKDEQVEIRTAFGNALADIAKANPDAHIIALDCDLEGSVKLERFKEARKNSFIECGIAEHNAATVAAAAAKCGVIAIHADFSVFNIAETYSQNRMADINKAPVKLFCTHAGLDVGEDGKTHQCIDYLSMLSNLYGFKIIVPADANQADSAVGYALKTDSPVAIIAGRSKVPTISTNNGKPLSFDYGKADILRNGDDGVIITYGNMAHRAIKISDDLKAEGVNLRVINISTPVDIDTDAVIDAAKTGLIITYEDHNVRTGIGTAVATVIAENSLTCKLLRKGIHKYGSSASPDMLYKEQGLDEESIRKEIKNLL